MSCGPAPSMPPCVWMLVCAARASQTLLDVVSCRLNAAKRLAWGMEAVFITAGWCLIGEYWRFAFSFSLNQLNTATTTTTVVISILSSLSITLSRSTAIIHPSFFFLHIIEFIQGFFFCQDSLNCTVLCLFSSLSPSFFLVLCLSLCLSDRLVSGVG